MAKPPEFKPKSFEDLISIVEKTISETGNPLWYRGCGNIKYDLTASFYRYGRIKNIEDLPKLEAQLLTRFRQRSIPFHDKSLDDDWEALFFMQHYGIPSRLLDWTENPFIAAHFAVMSSSYQYDGTKFRYKNPAAIWMLDPIKWNQHSLKHISFDQGVITTEDEQAKGFKPKTEIKAMHHLPVAIHGAHNSPRIVAQRGVFIIFGRNMDPMEKIYSSENYPTDSLKKIILNKRALYKIRKSILNHGTTESVVFPDLDGLSKEIRREFNLEG